MLHLYGTLRDYRSEYVPMTEIYLLRHAQTQYNASRKLIGGRSNLLPLSEVGRKQARLRGVRLREEGLVFDRVFCSSAVRARETLELILRETPLTTGMISWHDELNELSQGAWEGRLREEIYTPEQVAEINARVPFFKAPGGESHKEVEQRMTAFVMREIIVPYPAGRFLIVGHGMTFRCLLQGLFSLDPRCTFRLGCDNVSLTRLRYEPGEAWTLDYMNRI